MNFFALILRWRRCNLDREKGAVYESEANEHQHFVGESHLYILRVAFEGVEGGARIYVCYRTYSNVVIRHCAKKLQTSSKFWPFFPALFSQPPSLYNFLHSGRAFLLISDSQCVVCGLVAIFKNLFLDLGLFSVVRREKSFKDFSLWGLSNPFGQPEHPSREPGN